jgi:tetratricopeptide (TPR) repeat protein
LDDAKAALDESLTLARELGDLTRELFALNRLGTVAMQVQEDWDEGERLFTEIHTRAVAAGNRERAMTALNNLGVVASNRKEYTATREYIQQALALAREIGVQDMVALGLLNLAEGDIQLGQLAAARVSLREGLALAQRLGALPLVVLAVKYFGYLAHAEGQTERALSLIGLARKQPAWGSDNQHELEAALAEWALDPSVVEAGLKKGEVLDWEETVRELLKG